MTSTFRMLAAALSLGVTLTVAPSVSAQTAPAQTPSAQPTTTPTQPTPMQMPLGTVVTVVTPELMLATLQAAGYTAKLDKSGDNPVITLTRKSNEDIFLEFHNCKTGSCTDMYAYTYYPASDLKVQPTSKTIADWNSAHYTQAYIDRDDDDSVNLDSLYRFTGGFTRANFLNWLNEFRKEADSFDRMIDGL